MSKTKTIFVCQECGSESPKWVGKCPACSAWNSYVEESSVPASVVEKRGGVVFKDEPVLLSSISGERETRYATDIKELDRVLGGGVVKGSVILIGGDPGIGKSTLSLQIGCALSHKRLKVLYVSGEESVKQTHMRASRLSAKPNDKLYIVNQVDLDIIIDYIGKMDPDVVVIDSIQVLFRNELSSTPGSVAQVRECSAILTHIAKTKGISLFIIGHVTKDGTLAGPRVLEHIVDTVLYFEGERYSSYRVLRAIKNRFGSTNEIGVFEMTGEGLAQVENPSQLFLSERAHNAAGSVIVPVLEGSRPFLVEIQGLVSRSSFGMVRQKAQGFDANRLAMLVAVLEKRMGLNLQDKDIFLNVVGGVRVMDPAADLAVCLAIASSLLERPVSSDAVVLGEVGLSSEIRSVSQLAIRLNEAAKLGFKRCIVPGNNLKSKQPMPGVKIELLAVEELKEALQFLKD
jgi:DNA repair protein RadA/Sms